MSIFDSLLSDLKGHLSTILKRTKYFLWFCAIFELASQWLCDDLLPSSWAVQPAAGAQQYQRPGWDYKNTSARLL